MSIETLIYCGGGQLETIFFDRPELRNGNVRVNVSGSKKSFFSQKNDFEIEFNTNIEELKIDGDSMAAALMPMIGKRKSIFNFEVSSRMKRAIELRTGQVVQSTPPRNSTKISDQNRIQKQDKHLLMFSGGVDSLAADLLAPGVFTKVAVDWNGRFDREEEFFSKLDDVNVVSTNFRDIGDSKLDWLFMASPGFVINAHMNANSLGFGTILEATPSHWLHERGSISISHAPSSRDPRSALQMFDSTPTKGLTEFGTTLIVKSLGGDHLLEQSILSAADLGSEKHFRKLLMRAAVQRRLGEQKESLPLPETPLSYSFGQNFAVDMTLIVFRNLFGKDMIAHYVTSPGELTGKDYAFNVDWVFKRNPNHKAHPALENLVKSQLSEAGIEDYSKKDWDDWSNTKQKLWELHGLSA